MTVSYSAQVSSCRRFGCFWKLLFRWKGSIYKLLWPNLVVYAIFYTTLSFTYRFLLDNDSRTTFEKFSLHCQTYADLIPVSFVLGFYVSIVIKRWWDQYLTIPWPDALAVYVSTFVTGQDERGRLMRRTIMRYANLSLLLTLRMMCPTVKKRFPTLDHLVDAGFLLPNEKKVFEGIDAKSPHPKYWLPLVWATAIARRARREGKIPDDFALKTITDEIVKFRGGCGGLLNFDWISIPLVYTQVVTLAVYTYFTATLMGNQYLDPSKGYPNHTIDLVVPIFTLLQFFFYMGWLLVAETLVNPFGEDDDDFEVNWLIDRNLQISYVIVDEMHEEHPELIKDQYWDQVFPSELPYTEAAKQYYMEPFLGSAFGVDVPQHMQAFVMMSEMMKDDRRETTPMFIKGASQEIGDSLPSIQLIGSSLSLHKRKWRPFLKNVCSQPYSINSGYRFHEEDYQDDVFSMSGISLSPSRIQSSRYFCSEKEVFKREVKKNALPSDTEEVPTAELSSANSSAARSDGISFNPNSSCSKKPETMDVVNTPLQYESVQEMCIEKKEIVLTESSQNDEQLRNRSADGPSYPVLPAITDAPKISLMDINLIGKTAKLEILGDYKAFDCEINPAPNLPDTLLGPRSEAIDIPKKSLVSTLVESSVSEENTDTDKANFVDCDIHAK